MNEAASTAQTAAVSGLITIGVLIVVGLMLWAMGRRALRAGFALAGLIVGGCVGWNMSRLVTPDIPPWIVAAIGALLMACVGALAYRLVVAATLAVVLGAALPLGVWACSEWKSADAAMSETGDDSKDEQAEPLAGPLTDMSDELDDWLAGDETPKEEEGFTLAPASEGGDVPAGDDNALLSSTLGTIARLMDDARAAALRGKDMAIDFWENVPVHLRPTLVVSALIGIVLGVMLGTIVPGLSAAVVTAFGGSALWLGGGRLLLQQWQAEAPLPWLPEGPLAWLGVWFAASIIGLAIQWTTQPRRADSPR